ncbi:MAG: Kdo hydroxylase family protein [Betaproteobacteria bacterium]
MDVPIETWHQRSFASAWTADENARAAAALEDGGLVVLPDCNFDIASDERRFLDPRWLDGSRKNIGLDGERIGGSSAHGDDAHALHAMIARFGGAAAMLVGRMLPDYARHVRRARTSFRPAAASGRALSPRKDDTRLHVDAFPSRPNRGERILRVFCNVNPSGEDRVWRVGEPFADMAARFIPSIRPMRRGEAALLELLKVTKGRRSEYDHAMLALHDRAKLDADYQRDAPQREVRFAPGTTWLCFSDQVMHAAMSGQHMMEQTLHLPLAALRHPDRSPLATLERLAGHPMA